MPVRFTTQAGRDFARYMREEDEAERLAKEGQRLLASIDAFVADFVRSREGNLWRRVTIRKNGTDFGELTLTVFCRGGSYKICVADESGPRYGASTYDSAEEALMALWWGIRAQYGPEVEVL
jgi:hypothetical protein